jgi:hypothetical protein
MATFLMRALDVDAGDASGFSDVPSNHTHVEGINAVVAAGIARGTGNNHFEPDRPVSRAQMATFLAKGLDLEDKSPSFPDVDPDADHAGSIGAIEDAGITKGAHGGNNYEPAAVVARAQMATFLDRAVAAS